MGSRLRKLKFGSSTSSENSADLDWKCRVCNFLLILLEEFLIVAAKKWYYQSKLHAHLPAGACLGELVTLVTWGGGIYKQN